HGQVNHSLHGATGSDQMSIRAVTSEEGEIRRPKQKPTSSSKRSTRQDILVMGASGFIGSEVVTALLTQGNQVRFLVPPGSLEAITPTDHLEIVVGTLMDEAFLARVVS